MSRLRRNRRSFRIESLEDRRLMAVDVSLNGGFLSIMGDAADDNVVVAAEDNQYSLTVKTAQGESRLSFDFDEVDQIFFSGQGGNDVFANLTGLSATIYGGEGNDRLRGQSTDQILGGDGDDFILGGEQGAAIGGAGNDTLYTSNAQEINADIAGNADILAAFRGQFAGNADAQVFDVSSEAPSSTTTETKTPSGFHIDEPTFEDEADEEDEHVVSKGELVGKTFSDENTNTGSWGGTHTSGELKLGELSGETSVDDDVSDGDLSAKAKGEANLVSNKLSGEYKTPTIAAGGEELLSAHAKGSTDAKIGLSGDAEAGLKLNGTDAGLKADAEVFAGLQASAKEERGVTVLGIEGGLRNEVEAEAGASAEGKLQATLDEGLEAGGEVFAGAKAGWKGEQSFGGFKLSGTAEGWAGAGAEAGAKAKWEDGKIQLGLSLGAAPGIGGKLGFGFEIDIKEVEEQWGSVDDKVVAAWDAVLADPGYQKANADVDKFFNDLGKGAEEAVESIGSFFGI